MGRQANEEIEMYKTRPTYKVEGQKFADFGAAMAEAKSRLLGKPFDQYVLVYEDQEEGFWEPVARLDRTDHGIVIS